MSLENWKEHFPHDRIRPVQEDLLATLTNSWDQYDIFVISAPVASGKSAIAKTLLDSLINAAYICPTNQLLDQFLSSYQDTRTLHRLDSYYCSYWRRPCTITRAKLGRLCKSALGEDCIGCRQLGLDLSSAKYKRGPLASNFHTYLAHKVERETLIVDEAHTLLPVIKDKLTTKVWQHDLHYPSNMYYYPQIEQWIAKLPEKTRKNSKKIKLIQQSIYSSKPEYVVSRGEELFNGKGTIRGEPELRDCLKLSPVDVSNAPLFFVTSSTKKIILLSATISRKDVLALGLERFSNRIAYMECASPIPIDRRPIVPLNLFPISKSNTPELMSYISQEIINIADQHSEEKGVVHVTYQMARELEDLLPTGRYIFHDRDNKQEVYRYFRDSSDPLILVASGMYEGVDLPGDAGRWQVIVKVPWPSLGDPAIKYVCDEDPELYTWLTLRSLIQACGRISRHEEDFGVTIILDSTFDRLLRDSLRLKLAPTWWVEAIIGVNGV